MDEIQKFERSWMIPKTVNKPIDLRKKIIRPNKAGEMLCITRSLLLFNKLRVMCAEREISKAYLRKSRIILCFFYES